MSSHHPTSYLAKSLSPHTRGNHPPRGEMTSSAILWVYPRTHGETWFRTARETSASGLSPHTRGNLLERCDVTEYLGSIPAHTGKPMRTMAISKTYGVYPRTHGETFAARSVATFSRGLSPHTRGNQFQTSAPPRSNGSIPAHTGKPFTPREMYPVGVVYPRTHGETHVFRGDRRNMKGLSPHTRGNLPMGRFHHGPHGSIPAHTGKPHPGNATHAMPWVYPRTHGETVPAHDSVP